MYNPPIVKNGVKVYRINSSLRQRSGFILIFTIIVTYFGIIGMNLNAKSPFESMLGYILFGSLTIIVLFYTIQSMIFRLQLNEDGGTVYLLGKSLDFVWKDAVTLQYIYWPQDNKAILSLCLIHSHVKKRFPFSSQFHFPVHVKDDLVPLDGLYHQKSFWSLNPTYEAPTPKECSIHLRHFLHTPMGQDILQYAPHVLGEVLHKYLPDNDLQID